MRIKRVVAGLMAVGVVTFALTACFGHGPGHWRSDPAERQAHMVKRISHELDLNAEQKARLDVLANRVAEQRKALWGDGMGTDLEQVIAGERFDRTRAQGIVDQKIQVVQQQSPQVLDAMAGFYDSLDARQQQKVRDRLQWLKDRR